MHFIHFIITEVIKEINLVKEPNPDFVGVSSALKVTKSTSKGRFMAANGSILPGDILVVEEPYCACLLPEMSGTHCHHCFKRYNLFQFSYTENN